MKKSKFMGVDDRRSCSALLKVVRYVVIIKM